MSVPTVTISQIPGTSVSCYCTNGAQINSSSNVFLLYVSQVLSEGKVVHVKPISPENTESFNGAKVIAAKGLVIGIVKNGEEINFKAHESVAKVIADAATFKLVIDKEEIELGSATKKISESTDTYRPMLGLYNHYLQSTAKAIRAK